MLTRRTVGSSVPVTYLAHRQKVTEPISTSTATVVGFPWSMQHLWTPSSCAVVRAQGHRAFALSSRTNVKSLPGSFRYSHDSELLGPPLCLPTPHVALYYRCVGKLSSCGRPDSNRHGVTAFYRASHQLPKLTRLPFRHARGELAGEQSGEGRAATGRLTGPADRVQRRSREGLNNPILGGTRSVAVRRSGYEGLSER